MIRLFIEDKELDVNQEFTNQITYAVDDLQNLGSGPGVDALRSRIGLFGEQLLQQAISVAKRAKIEVHPPK